MFYRVTHIIHDSWIWISGTRYNTIVPWLVDMNMSHTIEHVLSCDSYYTWLVDMNFSPMIQHDSAMDGRASDRWYEWVMDMSHTIEHVLLCDSYIWVTRYNTIAPWMDARVTDDMNESWIWVISQHTWIRILTMMIMSCDFFLIFMRYEYKKIYAYELWHTYEYQSWQWKRVTNVKKYISHEHESRTWVPPESERGDDRNHAIDGPVQNYFCCQECPFIHPPARMPTKNTKIN